MSLITSLLVPLGLGYTLLRSVYRIWFHPLSKFPGPKLAAITHGYEFYYDVLNKGTYIWQIEKMHEEYGRSIPRFRSVRADSSQDRLCDSIRESFISKTHTVTKSYMLGAFISVTKIHWYPRGSLHPVPRREQSAMNITVSDVDTSTTFSRSRP